MLEDCFATTQILIQFYSYNFNNYIFLFIFKKIYCLLSGCAGFSLLHVGFSSCGERGLLSRCGMQVSHCSDFSCCGTQALGAWASVVVARGLRFVAHGLSCLTARGIFPDQGSNRRPLLCKVDS